MTDALPSADDRHDADAAAGDEPLGERVEREGIVDQQAVVLDDLREDDEA